MRNILSRACLPVLGHLAASRTLCAFDFDGTLAPIAERPDQALLRHRTRELLGNLAAAYPCVVLSGRRRADLLGILPGIGLAAIVGNHGAEPSNYDEADHDMIEWKAILEREIGSMPGVWIEDKGLSLTVHYRQALRGAAARAKILAAAKHLRNVHAFAGKMVVNLVREGSRQKGQALAAERDRLQCTTVLFVGDDTNDEDAFALGGDIVPVRVGQMKRSNARYYLRVQKDIDQLLEALVTLRHGSARSD